VLQELQDAGLLAAPHTSAGRMPTEMGLRLFVDGIMQMAEPRQPSAQIERGLERGRERSLAAARSRRRWRRRLRPCRNFRPGRA
jgi:heat-inducible transcriptional repressor